ncbi:uncharacterized protein LOC126996029 [Eriocheir sinensis]|uniref:uncharacterized protein LOC126996029 n=1 Tax=Eriocheir sinensis TaxID=95602 RepID=UPI0021C5EAF9|nr:uncharacterized protein LOC126996029 [Eriocheir sinensis]
MAGAWLPLLLCVVVAGAAEAGGTGGSAEPAGASSGRAGKSKKTEMQDNKRGRLLNEDEHSFVNYGNSVVIGPAPPRPEDTPPHTRANSKFTSSEPPTSPPPKGPPKTHIFRTSISSPSAPQTDMADILTNLQILNILTTQDSFPRHLKNVQLGVRNEGLRPPEGQMAGVYNIAARNTILTGQHPASMLHQLLLNPAPDPAGPNLASPFELPPLHTRPLQNESNGSVYFPGLVDPPDVTPNPTHSFPIPTHFTSNPAHSFPSYDQPTPKPAHPVVTPVLTTPSPPAHSTTTPTKSSPETVHFILGPVPIHSIPSPSHSFFDGPHSNPTLAHPPNSPHFPIGNAHSSLYPAHSTFRPTPSTPSPTHTLPYLTVTPPLPTTSPAPPSLGAAPPTSSSLLPVVPPPGLDLSQIVSQLAEANMAGPAPTPALPSLGQLTALSQYLRWLKELHQEQMQQLQQQQQQQEQQVELDLGPAITEEMILASLLHTHHVQEADQGPLPPSIEAPYVPALHGPFNAEPPAPPTPVMPPAPPNSLVDLIPPDYLLTQTDNGSVGGGGGGGGSLQDLSVPQADAVGGGGGLQECVKSGGCALLAAGTLAALLTGALTVPFIFPVAAAVGLGRRRRSLESEGSGVVLEYLRQNRGALLAAGMARVEAEVGRSLDPALRQTLEQSDPRHLLPLLRHALAGRGPRSSGLLRQICEAAASPGMPPSMPTVVTAQHCLLLAAAAHL